MENEIWKDIPGYEGMYQVSDKGGIRSCERTIVTRRGFARVIKGKEIKPSLNNGGYLITHLCKGSVIKSFCVHYIVALAFIGKRPQNMDVDHINEDKKDNRICNLRYLSRHENASRSTKGRFWKGSNSMEHNPRTKRVVGYKDGEIVRTYPCAKYLTTEYGINYSSLRRYLQNGGIVIENTLYKYDTTA